MIENTLFWERFRPHQIDDMVLLDRIKNKFKNGVQCNYIFHGYSGTGKTTLTKILLKNKNVFVCEICGYIHIGDEAPDICPICKVPKFKFSKIE